MPTCRPLSPGRPVSIGAGCLIILCCAQARSDAWGFDAHRFIVGEAIKLLPPSIRPFYEMHRTFLMEHAVDPDLWRSAGFLDEPPRHFVDLDAYGAYPFPGLPREYDRAVEKFGPEVVARNGVLPWRTSEMYGRLERAFEQQKRGNVPFARDDIKFFSAVISHYVADGHQPFHAVLNYDGQLTGQQGIHGRFETELFVRFQSRLSISARPAAGVADVRALMFDVLLASFQLADPILAADRHALGGRDAYDDRYFQQFFAGTKPILERRIAESISGVASVIQAAWAQAGRPALPAEPQTAVQRVRGKSPRRD